MTSRVVCPGALPTTSKRLQMTTNNVNQLQTRNRRIRFAVESACHESGVQCCVPYAEHHQKKVVHYISNSNHHVWLCAQVVREVQPQLPHERLWGAAGGRGEMRVWQIYEPSLSRIYLGDHGCGMGVSLPCTRGARTNPPTHTRTSRAVVSISPHATPKMQADPCHCNQNQTPLMVSPFQRRKPMGEEMVRIGCKRWGREGNSFWMVSTRLGEATHRSFRLNHPHKTFVYFFSKWTIFNSEFDG